VTPSVFLSDLVADQGWFRRSRSPPPASWLVPSRDWYWSSPAPRQDTNRSILHRQGDCRLCGDEGIYIDTMPETLIGTVAPAGPV